MGRMGRTGQATPALIGERYRLLEQLGSGGMSVVWRGYDEVLGRQVAVKVLSSKLVADERFRERLRQEALAAARLCHPHITGIFDFGETAFGDGPTVPYVVMELIDGEPVSARLRRQGPMTWREAVTMTIEVASALAVAHARGVVHRDITPANVMLTPAGAKVVDFGISALVGQRDAAPDGSLLGTPAYLAPERLAGGAVLPATDVYALGVLFYRCLTARLPWPAENTNEALRAHLYADPEPLPALPGLPAAVADLCFRCLAKDPDVRPAAADLARALADLSGSPVPLVPVSHLARDIAAATAPPRRPAPGRRRRPRRGLATLTRMYLGVPETLDGRIRRLRTVLRLGSRMHLGAVEALGGGVFVGGRLARDLITGRAVFGGRSVFDGRAVFGGRHRLKATAGTVALLAVAGLIWAGARGPAEVTSAQAAAGTGPAAAVLHTTDCRVTYRVWRDSGRDFDARLTLRNDGRRALRGWRLEFAYPGDQHLTAKPRRVYQNGRQVIVRGDANGGLAAGRSLTVKLSGAYRQENPLPQAFTMNGRTCDATLLGATSDPAGGAGQVEASAPADPEK